MSTGFDISAENCLVWTVEKPFLDVKRNSPTFSYLGIEWYLCLEQKNISGYWIEDIEYTLTLYTVDSIKKFNEKASLIVFVISPTRWWSECGGRKSITESSSETCFFIQAKKDTDYGKWTVYCIFSSDLPSELHIKNSETKQTMSTLTVQSNLLDSSNIIMKARLAGSASDDSFSDEENLSADFGKLLEQQSTSDVTLTCGDRTFSAHRIILAARSEVFAAMFQNKLIESETGRIDINDIDGEVFELLLKYVYTGKIPELSVDIVSSLYITADKYSIQSLKNKCSKWMLGNITKENYLEFLFVADTWNDAKLKDGLVNFVAEIMFLLDEDEWHKFSDKCPKLASSVYQRLVSIKNC